MKYVALLATVVFTSSCCTEKVKDCLTISNTGVAFNGYSTDDLDTVIIKEYQGGSNMTVLIDSTARSVNQEFLSIHSMNASSDFRVEVPATGQTVSFTNPIYRKRVCEECTSMFGSDKKTIEDLESIEINGTRTSNSSYQLTKP